MPYFVFIDCQNIHHNFDLTEGELFDEGMFYLASDNALKRTYQKI